MLQRPTRYGPARLRVTGMAASEGGCRTARVSEDLTEAARWALVDGFRLFLMRLPESGEALLPEAVDTFWAV